MIGASASFALCANVAILAPPAAPTAFLPKSSQLQASQHLILALVQYQNEKRLTSQPEALLDVPAAFFAKIITAASRPTFNT